MALFALDRLFLWMEARGWLYWRKVKRKASAGGTFMSVGGIFDPGVRHLTEAQEQQAQEDEEDGDDDDKRKAEDQVS